MPTSAWIAVAVGALVVLEFARRRRRGENPLGRRPTGELADTRFALLFGSLVWLCLAMYAVGAPPVARMLRLGGAAAGAAAFAFVNFVVALGLLRTATSGARRPALAPGKLVLVGVCGAFALFAAQFAIGQALEVAYAMLHLPQPQQAIVDDARQAGGLDVVVFALCALVIAPFAEEVFFRGILLPAVARVSGEHAALVFQAAAFGLVHVLSDWRTWPLAIPLALVGWLAGRLYLRTGSLAVPIVLHATFNALNFVALRAA